MEPLSEEKKQELAARLWNREKKGEKPGVSYPNKILKALELIYMDPTATVAERLQACRLSAEILPYRKTPKRKTDKDRAVLEALKKGQKKPTPSQG